MVLEWKEEKFCENYKRRNASSSDRKSILKGWSKARRRKKPRKKLNEKREKGPRKPSEVKINFTRALEFFFYEALNSSSSQRCIVKIIITYNNIAQEVDYIIIILPAEIAVRVELN